MAVVRVKTPYKVVGDSKLPPNLRYNNGRISIKKQKGACIPQSARGRLPCQQ